MTFFRTIASIPKLQACELVTLVRDDSETSFYSDWSGEQQIRAFYQFFKWSIPYKRPIISEPFFQLISPTRITNGTSEYHVAKVKVLKMETSPCALPFLHRIPLLLDRHLLLWSSDLIVCLRLKLFLKAHKAVKGTKCHIHNSLDWSMTSWILYFTHISIGKVKPCKLRYERWKTCVPSRLKFRVVATIEN